MKAGHKSVRNRRDTASSADDPNAITLLVGGPRWQPGPSYQDRTYRSRSVSVSAIRGHDSTVAQLDDAVRTIDHERVVGGDHGRGEAADRLAALDLTRIAEPGGIVRIRVSRVASGAETVCVRHRASLPPTLVWPRTLAARRVRFHPQIRTEVSPLARHSRAERERREQQNRLVVEIEAAWRARLPAAQAKAFELEVAAARARGPEPKRPDMAPGTAPRPPRPGREPKPPKEPARPRRNG
jgi:hypothetical protein